MVDAAIAVFSRVDIKDILYRQMIALGGFAKCQEKSSLPPTHPLLSSADDLMSSSFTDAPLVSPESREESVGLCGIAGVDPASDPSR